MNVGKHWHLPALWLTLNLPRGCYIRSTGPHRTARTRTGVGASQIEKLQEELRQQRIDRLGPRSETLSDLQLELLADEEPGATRDEVEAEAQREPIANVRRASGSRIRAGKAAGESAARRRSDRVPGAYLPSLRRGDSGDRLRRERAVGHRAGALLRAGDQAREAGLPVLREGAVVMAPLAPRIVEKGLASDRVVIQTVVAKYCDHLPLYRQAAMLEREAGVEIGRATLDGWVMRVGELLEPVSEAMRRDLLAARIYKPTRRPCRCRCTTNAAPIIRRTCGSTASRAERRCSSSVWAAGAKVRRDSSETGKGFCKPTATSPTNKSAGRSWCM